MSILALGGAIYKVKKIYEDGPDSIPSPSVKIQIMGGKFCLRHKGKTLLEVVNKLLKTKTPSNVSPLHLNIPAGNLRSMGHLAP